MLACFRSCRGARGAGDSGRGGGVVGKEGGEVQIVWDPSKDLLAW